ncbi:ArnT family glycosyltransferase [Nocardia sp. NPDC020380]|uniref:ArnT family glycosyltransferase n=1 Tax=Nocardia sp. NPDC020380 TaxID=3364309 RepID=UPI00378B4A72
MTTATLDTPAREQPAAAGPATVWRIRGAFWALLATTGVLYLWGLSRSGWANDFYAAAVQAGTQNWKALLFGSLDAGNAITVDKPPAAMWVMGLSGRVLGFSSFSMLLPQALMGVASVALVYAAVKRWSGPTAGLLAGAALALTPVAALMFKFNNPDALLVLLLVGAAYCTVRATENGSGRWLAGAGVCVGFAFLAKLMQAFLVLPALGLVFLIAAPIALRGRIFRLLGACLAMVISGGWFVALVSLWPADSRPYIGGSTDNSLLQLALGYNGLGRVLGGNGDGGGGGAPHGGPGGGNTMFGGSSGITRLFGASMGTEISWLLPAALIGLLAGLWLTRRAPRTDHTRAGLVLWGGWLLVTAVVFSYMQGIMHPYYTVALAPEVAAVVWISVWALWKARESLWTRIALGAMLGATGVWNYILLDRTPDWYPALRWIILIGSLVTAVILAAGVHRLGRLTAVIASAALLFGFAGSAAYTVDTALTPHTGAIPTSGPSKGHGMGFPGGGPGGASSDNAALESLLTGTHDRWSAAAIGSMQASGLELSTGTSIMAIGGFNGGDPSPTLAQFEQYVANGDIHYFLSGGGMGGSGGGGRPGDTSGAGNAPGDPAAPGARGGEMPGTPGGSPDGKAGDHGGMGGFGGGSANATAITAWVKAHYKATTVDGTTVYDLTSPTTS